jgi:aspartate carbamoyltransferase catalytic subunit
MLRLGGAPLKFDEKVSSLKKKESIKHTARILSGQCDILVDRHKDPSHIYRLVKHSLVPVINGGNGSWQHPTQTLLDLYTMYKEFGIDVKIIAIVGDLKYGRTTHSLIRGLGKFDGVKIHGISPPGLELPKEHIINVNYTPHIIDMSNLKAELEKIKPDYIYATRVQLERIPVSERTKGSYQYQINKNTLENLPNARILHPLPIATHTEYGPEIAEELDDDPRTIYFKQADYGIPVRMAIIATLLGYEDEVRALG